MTENSDHFCAACPPAQMSEDDVQRLSGHKAALLKSAKWPLGAVITLRFLEGDAALTSRVAAVAKEWTRGDMANLTFDFRTSGPSDIRIAFRPGKGSWSYIGTGCRTIPEPQPTMNYGWLTLTSSDDELRRVVLHEFGHAIGLIHEHQNPKGGVHWNEDAVVRDLSGPPNNWDKATIDNNIFKKYSRSTVIATNVDPQSIMMYPIPRAWTLDGFSAGLNSRLSAADKALVHSIYPR